MTPKLLVEIAVRGKVADHPDAWPILTADQFKSIPAPRTDAETCFPQDQGVFKDPDGTYVPADFARMLERELICAQWIIAELEGLNDGRAPANT